MMFYETVPEQPNWSKIYKEYKFTIGHRVLFNRTFINGVNEDIADITNYYEWAEDNGISMKHFVAILPNKKQMGTIAFMFNDETYPMAFKLKWI